MKAVVLVLFSLFLFQKVAAQGAADVQGFWNVNLAKTCEIMTSAERRNYDEMPHDIQARLKQSFAGRSFEFNDHGEVIVKFVMNGNVNTNSGIWAFDLQKQELVISIGKSYKQYSVTWQGKDALLLTPSEIVSNAVFQVLYLTRN